MKKLYIVLAIILILVVYFFYFFKSSKELIKIGFVGALTAKYSDLGNPMMNGIILAFEEEGYEINGKKIELIFKDDKKDEQVNREIVNDFIAQGIKIVMGNVTSSMSKISMSIINEHKDMFMISAASASNEFSGIDDQFFRVHVANNAQRFDSFTKYIINNNHKKIYGIYDPGNITYAKDYLENFEKSFISNGADSFIKYAKTDENLDDLVSDINSLNPDLILICANSVDAARLVQYLKMKNVQTQIASSEWAMTPAFIENSGKYSEEIIFNIDYDEHSKNEDFINFSNKFRQKYQMEPSLFASKGYELAKVIIELLKMGNQTELKKNLLIKKEFKGLQDTIIFDQYGDVIREFNTFKVINGKFEKVK